MMNIFRTQGDRQVDTGTYDAAVVIYQHSDGSCDVRLLNDLALIVRRVHVKLSNITLDVDARARACAANLHTEGGAHVSRHATSTAMMNEGAAGGSARQHNDD